MSDLKVGDWVLRKGDRWARKGQIRSIGERYAYVYWLGARQTHRIQAATLVPDTPENRAVCHERQSAALRREYERSNVAAYALYKIICHEANIKPTHPGLAQDQPILVPLPSGGQREVRTLADWDAIKGEVVR